MKKIVALGILLTLMLGCAHPVEDSVILRWNVGEGEPLRYSASISEVPVDPQLAVHGFDILNDNGLREKIKHRLKNITVPAAAFEARVKRQGERMQASLVSVVPVYDAPPENDDEEFQRRIVASQSGRIELLGHFAEDGQLLDFFAHQKQRNLLNLFFAMPALPVSQGSSWELDVKLTEVGSGFHFEYADRMRDAFLDQVYEVNGENVAQLFYVVSEQISGYFKPALDDDKMPVESRISHIAYGEFLVDQGKWAHFTMVAYTTGSGLSKNESMMIYALRP